MNPLVIAILSRVAAGAIGAAAVPTVAQGEPAIVPTSIEELAVQAITAVAAVRSEGDLAMSGHAHIAGLFGHAPAAFWQVG